MAARPPRKELIRTVALVMAPVAAAFVVLMVAGQLTPGPGLIALAACCGVIGLLSWRHLRDLALLRALIEGLTRRPSESTPKVGEGSLVSEHDVALRRQRREWIQHNADVRSQLSADEIIIDSLPDPMLTLDERLRVIRTNSAATAVLGRAATGRDLSASLRHPDVMDAVQQALLEGGDQEVEFALPGLVERAYKARIRLLSERPTDGSAVVVTLHDLTEVKRTDQMRADFVANASHELRTPLSALVGFIETLRGPASGDAETHERFLGIMQEQAGRMARLISDLLSLSRIELSEHSRPTGRADLVDIGRRVAESMELEAASREMSIVLKHDVDTAPIVGDADQLEQVIQNLVDNALKYGPAGTVVDIAIGWAESGPSPLNRLSPGESVFSVAVHNAGEGIAPEHLPRLTERFYRIDPARSRELGGTGLGLAIVKHIVNRHRGVLTVESAPGRGATFTVHLLAAPQPPRQRSQAQPPGEDKAEERVFHP